MTDDRRDQHLKLRIAERARVRGKRARMSLGRRADDALSRAHMLAGASAPSTETRVASGKPGGRKPPTADGPEGSIADVYARRLRLTVEALENEVDAMVFPVPAELAGQAGVEKDRRLIRDFEGYDAVEVSFLDPSMGTPKAVERARVRLGVDPYLGREKK